MGRACGAASLDPLSSGTAASGGPPASALQLFKLLCVVGLNGVALRPLLSASSQERYGLALYAAASLLNHSCVPNATLR